MTDELEMIQTTARVGSKLCAKIQNNLTDKLK